jgi:hypothetical protein
VKTGITLLLAYFIQQQHVINENPEQISWLDTCSGLINKNINNRTKVLTS